MAQGWVAFLRAVNLGATNKVPMARLREVLASAGFESVRTYIQSGNVLFEHGRKTDRPSLVEKLERVVHDAFGVRAAVILRTFDELEKLVAAHPFGADTSHTHVFFLTGKPPAKAVRELERLDIAPDRVTVAGSDVFLHQPNGVQGARLSTGRIERDLGLQGTLRTWRTVRRLAEMAEETPTA